MEQVICFGSGSKDIFFPLTQPTIIESSGPAERKLIAFEYGAKVHIEDRTEAPGGCAVNVAQGLAKLSVSVSCVTCLGNDSEGAWIRASLAERGVGLEGLQEESAGRTDLSIILVDTATGERTVLFNRDANEQLAVVEAHLTGGCLFVSALNGDWQQNLRKLLAVAKRTGMPLFYNPGQDNIARDREAVVAFARASSILLLNRDEAMELAGGRSESDSALTEALRKVPIAKFVITNGAQGSWAFDGEHVYQASATQERVVDVTGAGDAFSAGFLSGYLRNLPIAECLERGAINGGSVVNYYGAQAGLLSEAELAEKRKSASVTVKVLM